MDAESPNFITKPSPENRATTACFDCNICLDFPSDPVVTLCGHLYCWPCIFRWLQLKTSSNNCPVCKSPLSNSSLVPLYGCGVESKPRRRYEIPVPDRPRDRRSFASQQNCHFYGNYRTNHFGVLNSTAGSLLAEIAFAVLPWRFGRHRDLRARRMRPRELMVENLLHQIWIFLFCCSVFFLMLF